MKTILVIAAIIGLVLVNTASAYYDAGGLAITPAGGLDIDDHHRTIVRDGHSSEDVIEQIAVTMSVVSIMEYYDGSVTYSDPISIVTQGMGHNNAIEIEANIANNSSKVYNMTNSTGAPIGRIYESERDGMPVYSYVDGDESYVYLTSVIIVDPNYEDFYRDFWNITNETEVTLL